MTASSAFVEHGDASGASVESGLKGKMGSAEVVFTVLAYNAPALAFMGFLPVMILMGNGIGTPALHLAVGALILVVAGGLMRVASILKRPGGFYAYTTASLGREIGLATGFASMLTYFFAMIANYVLSGVAFSDMVSGIFNGPEIPWPVGAAIIYVIVGMLGYFNIGISAKALMVFLGLELILIVTYIIAVFAQGGADGITFASFEPANFNLTGSIAVGGLFAVGLFGGFEATVIFRDEVKDPERTIPRATYMVVILISVLYAVAALALINAYGANVIMDVLGNDVVNASGESIREYVGDTAYNLAVTLLFTSALAGTLAAHNVLSRYMFNLAADGVLPRALGISHVKHVSPHRASIASSAASLVAVVGLAVTLLHNNFLYGYVAGIYSYGMLVMMVVVSFAIGIFLLRNDKARRVQACAVLAVGVVMVLVLGFASLNFDLLSGMTGTLGVTVMVLLWLFIASGGFLAAALKRMKPEVYARIGRQ